MAPRKPASTGLAPPEYLDPAAYWAAPGTLLQLVELEAVAPVVAELAEPV
jgi:hypothetical protein